MQYTPIMAKTLLSSISYADSWFHTNCSLNAYRGCEFACVYCDGMSEHYHVDDFQTHVRVKANAPEILRRELKKMGFSSRSSLETESLLPFLDDEDTDTTLSSRRGIVIGISGGVSDAYQPAEEKYRITRRILEVLLDFELPVFILTKSTLVLRDLDLLKEIHKMSFANVCFTITLHDEEIKRVFEPKSPATWERFVALKKLRRAGIFGGVMALPIIPGIGTSEENIRGLVRETKKAGGEFIQFSGLTLKPGRQKDYFMRVVKHRFPQYHEMLQRIYKNNDTYGNPIHQHLPNNLLVEAHRICKQEGVSDRSIRHRPPWMNEVNHRVLSDLLDIIFIRRYAIGRRDPQVKQMHSLAEWIEKGTVDLSTLQDQGTIPESLGISKAMRNLVSDLLRGEGKRMKDELWSHALERKE
ncbi:MAG: hypothetical protein K9W43_12830 [Candidatus Thorarchaeota archaeon]|nr:hypothetical protein [Candidatus Thorarchaeota archaeon]